MKTQAQKAELSINDLGVALTENKAEITKGGSSYFCPNVMFVPRADGHSGNHSRPH